MDTYSMAYERSERGSTLVSVLLLLVIITIIGVMAMKQGLTSLNIATNSQVQTILAQSSDTVINQFANTDITTVNSLTGVLGAVVSSNNLGMEYVFCYRPTSTDSFGQTSNANVIQGNADGTVTAVNVSAGNFCDLTADFGSGRKAVVTQVAVTVPTDAGTLPPLSGLPRGGTDISVGAGLPKNFTTQQRIRVTATSMLPAFSATSLATVQSDCVQGRVSDNTDPSLTNVENMTDCLAREGVPANTQVQEFSLQTTLTNP
ncbi:MAG: type IV fimbrial biogenesis protein [Aquirhabdus sp.]